MHVFGGVFIPSRLLSRHFPLFNVGICVKDGPGPFASVFFFSFFLPFFAPAFSGSHLTRQLSVAAF